MRRVILLGVACLGLLPTVGAAQYYTFQENSKSSWEDPMELVAQAAHQAADLLAWSLHENSRPVASEKYNRKVHFGVWIDDHEDENCFDTRSEVLIRDALSDVQFYQQNPCKVYSGKWHDPYSDQLYTRAIEVEIDHVVALKNAYDSGAWSWKPELRCLYANFMGDPEHLVSASSNANKAKGDKGPEGWMPKNLAFSCQHLHNWLMVKYVWNLNMTEKEVAAIQNYLQEYDCDPKEFKPSKKEIVKIRQNIQRDLKICQ